MHKSDLDASRARILELYELLQYVSAAPGHISMRAIKKHLGAIPGFDEPDRGEYDRRTIYRDIFLLNNITNLSAKYDKKLRAYRVDVKERLTEQELQIVVNAILAARFDSASESEAMVSKLYALGGPAKAPGRARGAAGRVKLGAGADTMDKLALIQKAIEKHRKIMFDYRKYTLNKRFEVVREGCLVSPYKLLWQNDMLYLVGNFEGNTFAHYRIERICNLRVTKEKRKPVDDIVGVGHQFDEAEYLRQSVGLSRGERTRVVIRFQSSCLNEVFDSLGKDVRVRADGDGFVLDDKALLNKKFVRWVLGFGAFAEVLEPEELREELAAALNEAGKLYK